MSPVIPDSADLSCLVLILNKQNAAWGSLLDPGLCVLFFYSCGSERKERSRWQIAVCQEADGKHAVQKGMCGGSTDVPGNPVTAWKRKQKCKVMKELSKGRDPLGHPKNTHICNSSLESRRHPRPRQENWRADHVCLLTDTTHFHRPYRLSNTVQSAKCSGLE